MKTKLIMALAMATCIIKIQAMDQLVHRVSFINDTLQTVSVNDIRFDKDQEITLDLPTTRSFVIRMYDKLESSSRIGATCFPFYSKQDVLQHTFPKHTISVAALTNAKPNSVVKSQSSAIAFFIVK